MLGTIGKDFRYKIIDNFLSKDEIQLLEKYCFFIHRSNREQFDEVRNNNGDTGIYIDPLMESLLLSKQKIIETESNLKLFPTYTYWRMYTRFATLKRHRDRPSCEISASVQISSDGVEWPLYLDGKEIILKNGQAVIYTGMELPHWREVFEGDYQAQCFLHYVDSNGKNKDWKFDKRPDVGM